MAFQCRAILIHFLADLSSLAMAGKQASGQPAGHRSSLQRQVVHSVSMSSLLHHPSGDTTCTNLAYAPFDLYYKRDVFHSGLDMLPLHQWVIYRATKLSLEIILEQNRQMEQTDLMVLVFSVEHCDVYCLIGTKLSVM